MSIRIIERSKNENGRSTVIIVYENELRRTTRSPVENSIDVSHREVRLFKNNTR